jgi:tRNA threonylcarbamoyladenosine biosynthesis protein TsaB
MPELAANPARPPLLLAFDAAGAALSVALCRGGQALAALHLPMQRGQVEQLLPAVAGVLAAGRQRLADCDAIATTVGPGSFTGLRTGLAAAQGLAFGADKPLVGIDRHAALALACLNPDNRPLIVAFDSKAGSLYVQTLDARLQPAPGWPREGRNLTPEEAAAALAESGAPPTGTRPLLLGDGAPALLTAGVPGEDTGRRTASAWHVAAAAARELAAGRTGWPARPLYLAPPRAKLPVDGGRLRARQ